jgi:hypothetical protein
MLNFLDCPPQCLREVDVGEGQREGQHHPEGDEAGLRGEGREGGRNSFRYGRSLKNRSDEKGGKDGREGGREGGQGDVRTLPSHALMKGKPMPMMKLQPQFT